MQSFLLQMNAQKVCLEEIVMSDVQPIVLLSFVSKIMEHVSTNVNPVTMDITAILPVVEIVVVDVTNGRADVIIVGCTTSEYFAKRNAAHLAIPICSIVLILIIYVKGIMGVVCVAVGKKVSEQTVNLDVLLTA